MGWNCIGKITLTRDHHLLLFFLCVCVWFFLFFVVVFLGFFLSFFLKPFAAVLLLLLFSPFVFACSIGIVLGMQCECCSNSIYVILLKTTCGCRRTQWQFHAGPVGQVASRWSQSTPHPHCPTAAPHPKYQVSASLLLLLCFFSSAPCPRYTSAQCLCSLASVCVSSCSSAPAPRWLPDVGSEPCFCNSWIIVSPHNKGGLE